MLIAPKPDIKNKIPIQIDEELTGVDTNLDLTGEKYNYPYDNHPFLQDPKKQLAISLLRLIQRNPKLSITEKNKIKELIQKVKTGEYYNCQDDLNNPNNNFCLNQIYQKKIFEIPCIYNIKDSLDYDIELYKIGKSCNGLKKRFAIIKNNFFYSSITPIEKFDPQKSKNKTEYLSGAIVNIENKHSFSLNQGEWKNINKDYRIRINYQDPYSTNDKWYSFFLYFDSEKKMHEVQLILFRLTLTSNSKQFIFGLMNAINRTLINGNLFYTILKILEVKNKIKKNKSLKYNICYGIKKELIGKLSLESKYLKRLSMQRKETMRLKAQPIKREFYIKQYNDSLPLIAGVNINNGGIKSLPNLVKQFRILKTLNIKKMNKNNKKCITFSIHRGAIFENDCNRRIQLNDGKCKNAKYIYIDKSKPEIQFKQYNDIKNVEKDNILSGKDIYEISNVILNSNINNIQEDNSIVIYGPKINNKLGIEYKYYNNSLNFVDPELLKIKTPTINIYNSKEGVNVLRLQIFQLEYDINSVRIPEIKYSLQYQNNNLLLGYNINISNLYQINSNFKNPKICYDNMSITEFNNEYYIPLDLFTNNKFIINCKAILNINYNRISNELKNNLCKFITPINLGYTEIDLNSIKNGIYEYQIYLFDQKIPRTKLILTGFLENIPNLPSTYIPGLNYSIGHDSYCIKEIDKEFIDNAKGDPYLNEEIKNKYLNVAFDDELPPNFLFRPNENMSQNEFLQSILTQKASEEEASQIFYNQKFPFLPMCEKYDNEQKLRESNNLKILPNDEIGLLAKECHKNDWIYKQPRIKTKLLTKNLGVTQDGMIIQYTYCINENNIYNINQLKSDKYSYNIPDDQEYIIPINEKTFNLFDKKEIEVMRNLNNFQWKLSIKFNNELQMLSFIKLLILLREETNTKMKNLPSENKSFDYKKLLYLNPGKNEMYDYEKCNIIIDSIEFRKDYEISNDCLLDIKILRVGKSDYSLLQRLDVQKYKFRNSLFNIPEIQNEYKRILEIKGTGGNRFLLPKKAKLEKSFFNHSGKKFSLKNIMKTSFPLPINKSEVYGIEVYFLFNNNVSEKFYTPFETLSKIINNKMTEIAEIPLYKDEDGEEKIYGYLVINLWCNERDDREPNQDEFTIRYLQSNINYLQNPSLLLNNQINSGEDFSYNYGIYEPNIFRRKILKLIHQLPINIDPTNLSQSFNINNGKDIQILYNALIKKCVILPEMISFASFDYTDIRKNFSKDINKNTYRRQLGYKLLKFRKHEEFMKLFSLKEWKLFFKKLNNNNNSTIDIITNMNKINLIKSTDISEMFHNLIFLGIPMEYRLKMYHFLLETFELCNKTKDVLFRSKQVRLNTYQEIFNYFVEQIYINDSNIIFSVIDNDINYLDFTKNSSMADINDIKKIAKAFIKWTELNIRLKNFDKGKYIYFVGILSIIQKLKTYFKENYHVFWIIIGLSQFITYFHQQNPLFSDETNYLNIFGLVIKLILECHHKNIYNKFISLNIPPEFFFSKHLSTLYTNYFKGELMMRILDILIFESAYKEKNEDKFQYLRILCAIPITLLELSEKRIIECESVSEMKTIFDDLISHTLNINKFIFTLEKNVNKFYIIKSFLEKWIFNNQGREWDEKREKIQTLIYEHFDPIYKQNIKYLEKIYSFSQKIKQDILTNLNCNYFSNLETKLNSVRILYGQGTPNSNTITCFDLHISKLQSLTVENTNLDEFKLLISYKDSNDTNNLQFRLDIIYDKINRVIKNICDLICKDNFEGGQIPKYIYFTLCDKNYSKICSFMFDLNKFEPMKLDKITLESRENSSKFFLEFIIFKYTLNKIPSEDFELFNFLFSGPEYIHSIPIEEQFYSYIVSNYDFNNSISSFIKRQNNLRNQVINNRQINYDNCLIEQFKKLNNFQIIPDKYNSMIKSNNLNKMIVTILQSFLDNSVTNIVSSWLNNTNISFEEILYSFVLVDTSSSTIKEKLWLLFTIAQTKDKLIFNNDELSVKKAKELIYSLYKRFMIYFTKTDIEKMVDFLIKDEKLFNIKYAFIYNKINEAKILDFVYDKDRYSPNNNIKKKKNFEILFDNIDKELKIYLNHLNNHYNINSITYETLSFILTQIINKKDINVYMQNKYDNIKLIIQKDDIMYQRNFVIKYNPLNVTEFGDIQIFVNSKNNNDINNKVLCSEISNLEITNSYNTQNYITFAKFKDIFFKLPYLSDLFRISHSYMSEKGKLLNREFNNFKVSVIFEKLCYGVFYFPNVDENFSGEYDNMHEMKTKIKLSDTVDSIIKQIWDVLNNKFTRIGSKESVIKDYFKEPNKLNCFVCKYLEDRRKGEGKIKEKIGLYDSLFSSIELKNSHNGEIEIELDSNMFFTGSSKISVIKESGYCKIYYPLKGDFYWRKCKLTPQYTDDVNLVSSDYKSKLLLDKNDVLFAYNV